jgi:pteridine reductase
MTELPNSRPVVLVTGAARRVGAAIARTLHAAGYDLALHCRNSRSELDALIADLEQQRASSTLALQAELADVEALPDLVTDTIDRFGRLDGLVNNASTFYSTPLQSVTTKQWDELFASNARAPFSGEGRGFALARTRRGHRQPARHQCTTPAAGLFGLLHGQGRTGGDDGGAGA